jgi:hypothetical protein
MPFNKRKFEKLNFNAMNKTTLFTALFLLAGMLFNNIVIADDKPGSTKSTGKISVVIYPNPVMDVINVTSSEPIQEPIVETFNVNGQKVTPPQSSQGDGSNKMEVDMSNAAPGIYFLKIFDGKELIHVQQIIKL